MRLALAADRIFTAATDTAEPGVVLVAGDRIEAITASPPAGTPLLRLGGATLLPGLIDAHSHPSIVPSRGDQLGQMRLPVELQLASARSNVLADLLSGVTTLRSMGQELDVDFRLRDEIAAGQTMGPDLICSGVQLAKPGAHGHALTAVRTAEDIERLIDQNAAKGAGLIKIFTTGGVSSVAEGPDVSPFTANEIRVAADATHRRGLLLAAHAHGGAGARLALENGVDTLEHGALLDAGLIDLAAALGVIVVGTFSILEHPAGIEGGDAGRPEIAARVAEVRQRVGAAWDRILARGVRHALGSDSMHGCLPFDLARLVNLGASPARALRAATAEGAAACGLSDRGVLAAGMRADIVAVRGHPLEDILCVACPVLVMKAGRIVHAMPGYGAPSPVLQPGP